MLSYFLLFKAISKLRAVLLIIKYFTLSPNLLPYTTFIISILCILERNPKNK